MTLLTSASLATHGDEAGPAALARVLLHLVQEYARHVGHLDIVSELAERPGRRVTTRLACRGPRPGRQLARPA